MKTKKTKSHDTHIEAQIQEKTEIWRQIIITTGVVLVALIGSWQVLAIARLNNQPPTPVPSAMPAAATSTSASIQPTTTTGPTLPVVVVTTTGLPSATDTAPAKSPFLKPVNIDTSKWYRLTNESLGKDYSMDHWAATKDIVMNATGFLAGQYWGFEVSAPGYYTVGSEYYGLDILLGLVTANNNSLSLGNGSVDPKGTFWKLSSSTANCVRITSQELGQGWSLDLNTTADVPTPYMAQSGDSTSQCWHLTQVGSIK